jgi:hypothetical protein
LQCYGLQRPDAFEGYARVAFMVGGQEDVEEGMAVGDMEVEVEVEMVEAEEEAVVEGREK